MPATPAKSTLSKLPELPDPKVKLTAAIQKLLQATKDDSSAKPGKPPSGDDRRDDYDKGGKFKDRDDDRNKGGKGDHDRDDDNGHGGRDDDGHCGGGNVAPSDIKLSAGVVNENAAGAVIGALTAVDANTGDSHSFTVSDSRFEVVSGALKLKAGVSLDFEAEQSVTLNVTAKDAAGATFTKALTIGVNDVNEAPHAAPDQIVSINEGVTGPLVLATVAASDPDVGGGNDASSTFDDLTYALVDDFGLFQIDATGAVSLQSGKTFDFETGPQQYVLAVKVTDGGGLSDTTHVTVNVVDVNEAPSAGPDQTVSTVENVADTVVLATVTASDPDLGGGNDAANTFENTAFSLADDFGLFEIDASGAISLQAGKTLDYDAGPHQYLLDVVVTDGPGLTDHAKVTVNVTNDTRDDPPVIGTLAATSADENDPTNNNNDALGSPTVDVITVVAGAGPTYGGAGDDRITGSAGDDIIYGGSFKDAVNGNGGNDVIYGGSGIDRIDAGAGNDTIFGGSSGDILIGGSGDDVLDGGYGADTITTGGGADILRYQSIFDTNDTITDFARGFDTIDLAGIDANAALTGDQAFGWGGQVSTQTAVANSVTWQQVGANVVIYADTDGDLSTIEFSLTLVGVTGLSQADFGLL